VPSESIYAVLAFLKNERRFDYLVDITCVDYLNYRGATIGLTGLSAGGVETKRAADGAHVSERA